MAKPRINGTLTAEQVRAALDYDPETGLFVWKQRLDMSVQWNGQYAGHPAGGPRRIGYRYIAINSRRYASHRLAWVIMTGEWPETEMDHKDGNPSNNRWDNLRLASREQNLANIRGHKDSRCGLKGATYNKLRGTWQAQIMANRKVYHLGVFPTAQEAHEAYCAAAIRLKGEFARTA